ncbi:hypothetical protein CANCADRAFT_146593 [Tortispora caseinolytica NRRL Y-17796]|uniref:Proline dehydrogenase n=1 Tax=Tortispora caseinolytica NRRL Y-17796 TaxID=767744 RepID=A0A1E4T9M9_9ASCO|nr:hypothetical protein CANCADRAFT_146593 [Tortispora caseinolytica NRRL Y-17796]
MYRLPLLRSTSVARPASVLTHLSPVVLRRTLHFQPNSNNTSPQPQPPAGNRYVSSLSDMAPVQDPPQPSFKESAYLNRMNMLELLRFTLVSFMSSYPLLVRLSVKLLPYTPLFIVRNIIGPIYTGGETPKEVLKTIKVLQNRGFANVMLNYAAENAETNTKKKSIRSRIANNSVVQITIQSIEEVFLKVAPHTAQDGTVTTGLHAAGACALKPTGLTDDAAMVLRRFNEPEGVDPELDRARAEYLGACRAICDYVAENGKGKVIVVFDAEKYDLQQGVYASQQQMMKEYNVDGKVIVGGTIQMYLKDSLKTLYELIADARKQNYKICLKLVRGAYMKSEPDRGVIHDTKADTDKSFNEGVGVCIEDAEDVVSKLIVATHNWRSMELTNEMLQRRADKAHLEDADGRVVFAQLMGLCEDYGEALAKENRVVLKYVPWGPARETREYLIRRLEENAGSLETTGPRAFYESLAELRRRILRF